MYPLLPTPKPLLPQSFPLRVSKAGGETIGGEGEYREFKKYLLFRETLGYLNLYNSPLHLFLY